MNKEKQSSFPAVKRQITPRSFGKLRHLHTLVLLHPFFPEFFTVEEMGKELVLPFACEGISSGLQGSRQSNASIRILVIL